MWMPLSLPKVREPMNSWMLPYYYIYVVVWYVWRWWLLYKCQVIVRNDEWWWVDDWECFVVEVVILQASKFKVPYGIFCFVFWCVLVCCWKRIFFGAYVVRGLDRTSSSNNKSSEIFTCKKIMTQAITTTSMPHKWLKYHMYHLHRVYDKW